MIGTPSLLKEGKISHCDIPALDGCDLVGKLQSRFSVMVHMENDMHYRVYGYYKKNCQPDQIPVLFIKKILVNKKRTIFFKISIFLNCCVL